MFGRHCIPVPEGVHVRRNKRHYDTYSGRREDLGIGVSSLVLLALSDMVDRGA